VFIGASVSEDAVLPVAMRKMTIINPEADDEHHRGRHKRSMMLQ